jgi:hypothetical protein
MYVGYVLVHPLLRFEGTQRRETASLADQMERGVELPGNPEVMTPYP